MSKSLKRVQAHMAELGLVCEIMHVTVPTNTAQQAADAIGCELDQIVKSVIFRGEQSMQAILFLTAGGNRVDVSAASKLAGELLGKADADLVRAQTGFAIGGVAPIGHLNPIRAFIDPRLMAFPQIWAAAGTPHHMFDIAPELLVEKTGAIVAAFTE
ncbi:MAG: YbaK/EbsC family protein [Proteobacteria bacterium]|jgi:prolyl-tRNA editing enzyme YbaK/EbsC (Cys-tRNA(Pro) deacylase)|nr:YbaK/EbsC family protein [Pseudomonadota bacterium]MDA1285095.1 YbaK/EbsC family protein [Pseudomonadota bacterium]